MRHVKFEIIYGFLAYNWCNHSAVHVNSQAKAMAYWVYTACPSTTPLAVLEELNFQTDNVSE